MRPVVTRIYNTVRGFWCGLVPRHAGRYLVRWCGEGGACSIWAVTMAQNSCCICCGWPCFIADPGRIGSALLAECPAPRLRAAGRLAKQVLAARLCRFYLFCMDTLLKRKFFVLSGCNNTVACMCLPGGICCSAA